MKFSKYLKDNLYLIFAFVFTLFITLLLSLAFKISKQLTIIFTVIWIIFFITIILIGYYRKKKFYNELLLNLERLDKKYLVLETIDAPNFYEGKLLCDILYDIDKSMLENIKNYETLTTDFKEYIEMWIHEIKIPISTLSLMTHNHNMDKKFLSQIKRLESYVEQVLYYVRSENAQKDYLIKENKLSKIISNVALKNKDDLLEQNIDFMIENVDFRVLTDSKWLEFIINQIVNNSIKYSDNTKDEKYIKISVVDNKNETILSIMDNGIGIDECDISRVFDKTFTGLNGRIKSASTGMGLYIAKGLCEKLGHRIEIKSKKGKYTKVIITFGKNELYNVLK